MSKRSRRQRAKARAGSRMEPEPQLSDEQWLLIADLFPDEPPSDLGGRPRRAARECVEGILWVLRSGARWRDLPAHFPSPPTCWRRFKAWTDAGVWKVAWAQLCASSIGVAASIGKKPWPTARFPRRKKGGVRR